MPLRPQDLPFWIGLGALIVVAILQRRRLCARACGPHPPAWSTWSGSGGCLRLPQRGVLCGRRRARLSHGCGRSPAGVRAAPRRPRPLGALGWSLCLVVAAGSAAMVFDRWRDPGARLGWEPVSEALDPLRECPDRLFNEMLDGGYLILGIAKSSGVRRWPNGAYPPEVLRASRQADLFGDYQVAFRDYGINCAIVTTGTSLYSTLAGGPIDDQNLHG